MERVPIDLATLSAEEMKKVYENCIEAHRKCGGTKCSECYSHGDNFVGLNSFSCSSVLEAISGIVKYLEMLEKRAEKKELPKHSGSSKFSGKCESCNYIDEELFEKSGYLFCRFWHNFTAKEGFCYAWESVKNSEEPVDN